MIHFSALTAPLIELCAQQLWAQQLWFSLCNLHKCWSLHFKGKGSLGEFTDAKTCHLGWIDYTFMLKKSRNFSPTKFPLPNPDPFLDIRYLWKASPLIRSLMSAIRIRDGGEIAVQLRILFPAIVKLLIVKWKWGLSQRYLRETVLENWNGQHKICFRIHVVKISQIVKAKSFWNSKIPEWHPVTFTRFFIR